MQQAVVVQCQVHTGMVCIDVSLKFFAVKIFTKKDFHPNKLLYQIVPEYIKSPGQNFHQLNRI